MKKSINTFLKHPTKDNSNRSANPPVTRASTILFNSMQELLKHEKKIKANKKISYYSYGRYGSSTTIELENILKELEQAYHVFLTGTGFGGVALGAGLVGLAMLPICGPVGSLGSSFHPCTSASSGSASQNSFGLGFLGGVATGF